jgi:flagellar FliL protein
MNKIYAIILSCGVVAAVFAGFSFFSHTKEQKEKNQKKDETAFFFTLAPLVVNLKSLEGKNHILKAVFVVESDKEEDKQKINKIQPLILDQFQTYLRDMEVRDLEGSGGLERIRQELFSKIVVLSKPSGVTIKNILFKEFIIS